MSDSEHASHQRRRSAAVFAVATIVSRVAGLAREIAVSAMFGVGAALSAFTVAFQIPNLIRSLVADAALNASFVPVFTELQEKGERERAWRVASTVAWLSVLALVPLTVLCMALAPQIVGLFVDENFKELQLAVDLFRIMMPIVIMMALGGLVVGILNSFDHFSTPALAPIAWNAVLLVALLAIAPEVAEHHQIHVYAWGMTIGTLVMVLMPAPWMRGRGGRLGFALALKDPMVKTILILMLPVTISLGLVNLNLLVNTYFASAVPTDLVPAGAGPAVLDRAFRLYMLPQGVFSVAISTVFFPALARLIARSDLAGFGRTFAEGLRNIFILLLPTAALMLVLSEPMVRLLYQYGEFSSADTPLVAGAVFGFALGLVFNGASLLVIRAFFSLKAPWTPTLVSIVGLLGNAGAVWAVHDRYGVEGIAAATSAVNLVTFLLLYLMLKRRVGRLHTKRALNAFVLATVASAAAAAAAYAVWSPLDDAVGRSIGGQLVSMVAALSVAAVVYLVLALQLRLISRSGLRSLRPGGRA